MTANSGMQKASALYISHGGGPLPVLGDAGHCDMVDTLAKIAAAVERPSAIVLISAHWEEASPTVTGAERPSLIYDYYGFPKASYEIRYPAPGNPVLAGRVHDLLRDHGMQAALDGERGFDHGMFVPLKIMYPDADVPCVQLSLLNNLDPARHVLMGQALSPLREDDVLVIGSGFSFHNMKAFFQPSTGEARSLNESFDRWLTETCTDPGLDEDERRRRLVDWAGAPGARFCHPREEHLLPLHVCYGVAQSAASQVFSFEVLGKKASCYLW